MITLFDDDGTIHSDVPSGSIGVSRRRLGAVVAIGALTGAALVAGGAGPAQAMVGSGSTITVATPKATYVVAPASPTENLGSSFTATLQSALSTINGKAPALPPTVLSWSSSNRAVATVSVQGVVQTVGAGISTITASYSGGSVTTVVLVIAK